MPYLPDGVSHYDKQPVTRLPDGHPVWVGAAAWAELARSAVETFEAARAGSATAGGTPQAPGPAAGAHPAAPVLVVDTYPGVDLPALIAQLTRALPAWQVVDVEAAAALPVAAIDAIVDQHVTDDRVFGVMSHQTLPDFYDAARLEELGAQVAAGHTPTCLVGWGAALVPVQVDCTVLADLARWEIQLRQRAGAPTWRRDNGDEDPLRKYKRGYFVEWRVADRHKRDLFARIDYLLDTNESVGGAKLIEARTFRDGLRITAAQPFRVVPFFDPGPWGGQWMKEVCDLDGSSPNYAWCFDCVPEENSLLLAVGDELVEIPAIDLVLSLPRELLGERTFARFGAEFPIRFDFLDTMGGGNLSLQVHPLTQYIQDTFGMHYTQDESYYLLDAADDAVVYLGTRSGTDPEEMADALAAAARGASSFPAEKFVNTFPARKHDHFLIPAGTVHCSGANSMVLEISATPFIFTFKMWDWDRLGLDGRPRPIHLEHALHNIQWQRDTEWVRDNLVDQVRTVDSGDGWVEEHTGLHALEFIEVRRHWFTGPVPHNTRGTVNVLNLVEGAEAVVESPTGAFEPFVVHYAETFIVPAQVGAYTVRPYGRAMGSRLATVTASVRGTTTDGWPATTD